MMTLTFSGQAANLVLSAFVLGLGAYLLILRIDTVQLQKLSNWCLSRKAQLQAGRKAYSKSQERLSGHGSRRLSPVEIITPRQSVFGRVTAYLRTESPTADKQSADLEDKQIA